MANVQKKIKSGGGRKLGREVRKKARKGTTALSRYVKGRISGEEYFRAAGLR